MTFQEEIPTSEAGCGGDRIGRVETNEGRLSEELAGMMAAATGHAAAPRPDILDGAAMPDLWHWAAFPDFAPMSALADDGHPRRGGFLPQLAFSRRMWAGGALAFEGRLKIGETLRRRSEILAVDEKKGAGGPMVFVSVAHEVEGAMGRIAETQDIVYLDIPETFRPPKPIAPLAETDFEEIVDAGPARLFRFSAATFNAHRIHYDLPYAREAEKYPGLVVHGPLQAILLMEAAMRHLGVRPTRFTFRGVHPMFHDQPLRLCGRRDRQGSAIDLCTATPAHQGTKARMEWA